MRKAIGVIIFILLFPLVGIFVYLGQQKEISEQLCYSGTIESTQANLSFQVGGRITSVYVDEGDEVNAGKMLAEIDSSLLQAACKQARANLDQTKKNLERLEILLSVYQQTLPADVKRAKAGVQSAEALATEAGNDKERFDNLRKQNVVTGRDWEGINLKYETAAARLDEAKAVLDQARSNLKKIDLTRQEIKLAETQCQAAQAALEAARIQLGYAGLSAPFDGIITTRAVEPGEVVTPGREVLTVSDLKTVELKIFVGEEQIGKVSYGDKAEVKIDTYPDRTYIGTVSFISPEAEFTPKIIQTHKERVKLVFRVKLLIPNPDYSLKPGIPADACFQNE